MSSRAGTIVHIIIEYKFGTDLRNHLVQPFLEKAWSEQHGPAPCPAKSQKYPMLGNPPLPWGDYSSS